RGAQEVRFKNRPRRPDQVASSDLLNETRNIDVGGARVCARSIEAIEASVRFHQGLVTAQRRMMFLQALSRQVPLRAAPLQVLRLRVPVWHGSATRTPPQKPQSRQTRRSRTTSAMVERPTPAAPR